MIKIILQIRIGGLELAEFTIMNLLDIITRRRKKAWKKWARLSGFLN